MKPATEIKKRIFKDPILSKLAGLAKAKEIPLYLVGGYLRDFFIENEQKRKNREAKTDYDFTMPIEAVSYLQVIEEAFQTHFFKVGKEEMGTATYRIINREFSIDLTPFHEPTIDEDLRRRDFTINTIAFSLRDETLHSVEKALDDIERKLIRPVSNRSIDCDPLRMLRAIRYLCTLDGFTIHRDLRKEITLKKDLIKKIPGERIKMEIDRILLSPRPAAGVKYLYETGLLLILIPELAPLENMAQGQYHHLNALSHILLAVEKVSWARNWAAQKGTKVELEEEDILSLHYAALFHDIGKQYTYTINDDGSIHFNDHETYSSRTAAEIMERLRFSNRMRDKILRLIENHMRILTLSAGTKEPALKRLIHRMGDETPLLVLHTLADKEATRGDLSIQNDPVVEKHCLKILELFKETEIAHPTPLITGKDLLALGYSPGPLMGQMLRYIGEKQVEGEITDRKTALEVLKEKFPA